MIAAAGFEQSRQFAMGHRPRKGGGERAIRGRAVKRGYIEGRRRVGGRGQELEG